MHKAKACKHYIINSKGRIKPTMKSWPRYILIFQDVNEWVQHKREGPRSWSMKFQHVMIKMAGKTLVKYNKHTCLHALEERWNRFLEMVVESYRYMLVGVEVRRTWNKVYKTKVAKVCILRYHNGAHELFEEIGMYGNESIGDVSPTTDRCGDQWHWSWQLKVHDLFICLFI